MTVGGIASAVYPAMALEHGPEVAALVSSLVIWAWMHDSVGQA